MQISETASYLILHTNSLVFSFCAKQEREMETDRQTEIESG